MRGLGRNILGLGAFKPGAEVWVWGDVGTVLCRMLAVESSEGLTHSLHNFNLVIGNCIHLTFGQAPYSILQNRPLLFFPVVSSVLIITS